MSDGNVKPGIKELAKRFSGVPTSNTNNISPTPRSRSPVNTGANNYNSNSGQKTYGTNSNGTSNFQSSSSPIKPESK